MITNTSRTAKKILDQQGVQKTLARGLFSFMYLNPLNFTPYSNKTEQVKNKPKKVLFLGLGYNGHDDTLNFLNEVDEVYVFEYTAFSTACSEANIEVASIKNAKYLTESQMLTFLENEEDYSNLAIYIYKQNLLLFPRYWNSLLLKIEDVLRKSILSSLPNSEKNLPFKKNYSEKKVFFASFKNDLMHKEVQEALEENYYTCLKCPPYTISEQTRNILQINEDSYYDVKEIIQNEKPSFFLSINGRYLDANGRIFSLLEHLKIPLALWIVDNVWNILSAFKSDWWKECYLFVTDSSFISQLKENGAKHVYYLPLAGYKNIKVSEKLTDNIENLELLFVGHSAFTGKASFFNATSKNQDFLEKKKCEVLDSYLNKNAKSCVNFHTIYSELAKNENIKLWGSHDFRNISYYACELDIFHKTYWLNRLSEQLTIIGDKGWNTLLNKANILTPVDYYTTLPSYYNKARFTLNIPSMLMPSALTQRHFDVWLAGGFLFSAPTAGLKIFSTELQESISVSTPDELIMKMKVLSLNPNYYNKLKKYTQNEIFSSHLYKHRIEAIIDRLSI